MSVVITPKGLREFQTLTSVQDFRVLMVLLRYLNDRYQPGINQVDVARELGMSRQSVWSSYQSLREKGILQKERKHGVNLDYMNDELVKKVARMVAMPEPERSEEEMALDESFALAAKCMEEERRMKAARITGVVEGGKPGAGGSRKKEPPTES